MKKIRTTLLIMIIISSLCFFVIPATTSNVKAKPPAPPGKNKAPKVTITNPVDGSTVSGIVTISVEATDKEDGPLIPDIYIDGVFVIHANSYDWDTASYSDGTYTIYAEAVDSGGKIGSNTITVTVDNGSPPPPPPPGDHYALIVGISDYGYINDLEYCDEDATDWYNYFTSLGYDYITVLGDGNPSHYPQYDGLATRDAILQELNILSANKDAGDTISFVFSGHGAAFDRTMHVICPWDSDTVVWDYDVFDYEIADILGLTSAGNIFVFLDSCNSGGFIPEFQNNNPTGIMYVTTTCTAKGYGYDEPVYENGAWTYWFLEAGLVEGLSGHIDMEGNFDWAYNHYTHMGRNDRPQEWDENSSELFYLW
jgi:hypothetical protein